MTDSVLVPSHNTVHNNSDTDKYVEEEKTIESVPGVLNEDDIINNLSNIKLIQTYYYQPTHAYTVCTLYNKQLYDINALYQYNQLVSVDLSHNQLTNDSIHDLFKYLTNVSTLNVSHNQLTQFTAGYSENITHLNLSHNRIANIDELYQYNNLHTLDLSHNHIEHIHTDLSKLDHLHTLNLSYNHITSLRNLTCTALVYLNVSHNKLHTLDFVTPQTLLEHLDLSHNLLSVFDRTQITLLQHINIIDISHNHVTQLEQLYVLNECKHLHTLQVHNNTLSDNRRYHLMYHIPHLTTIDNIPVDGNQRYDANMLYSVHNNKIKAIQHKYLPNAEHTTQQQYDTVNTISTVDIALYWNLHLCQPAAIESMNKYRYLDDIINCKHTNINIDLSHHTIQPSVIWCICDLLNNLAHECQQQTPIVHVNLNNCIIYNTDNGRLVAIKYLLTTLQRINVQSLCMDAIQCNIQSYIAELCQLIRIVPTLQSISLSDNTLGEHIGTTLSCPALYQLLHAIQHTVNITGTLFKYLNMANNQLDIVCTQLLCQHLHFFQSIDVSNNPQVTNQLNHFWYTLQSNTTIATLVCQSILSNKDWYELSEMLLIYNSTITHVDISNNKKLFNDSANVEQLQKLIGNHSVQRTSAFVLESIDVSNTGLTDELFVELSNLANKQTPTIKLIRK